VGDTDINFVCILLAVVGAACLLAGIAVTRRRE
jgi:hypothetical protein